MIQRKNKRTAKIGIFAVFREIFFVIRGLYRKKNYRSEV